MIYRPQISACIVTYNNAGEVEKTIASLLEHTQGADLRLFVADNASSDGTPARIARQFPQVTLLCGPNDGFGAGHNRVLGRLESEYHFIINPDILIQSDVLTQMALYLHEHPEVGLVSPHVCFPDGTTQVLGKRIPTLRAILSRNLPGHPFAKHAAAYEMRDVDLSRPTPIQFATGCFMGIRTSLFEQIGGFDTRYFLYFEDADLTREVNQISTAVYLPDVTVIHAWGRAHRRSIKALWRTCRSMFQYFHKWKGRP